VSVWLPAASYWLVGRIFRTYREHLGKPVASTAVLADRTEAFYAEIKAFAARHGIPVVEFASGQRKDDVMREHLAAFRAAGRTEGVVFIGRAQEKVRVRATTRRRDAEGNSYPWLVRDSRVVTGYPVIAPVKWTGYPPTGHPIISTSRD
jgi:hypothetical protein